MQARIVRVRQWYAVQVGNGWLSRWRNHYAIQDWPFTFACEENAVAALNEYRRTLGD